MDLQSNIGYKEVLGLVMKLPDKEREQLIKEVSAKKKAGTKLALSKAGERELTEFQKMLLTGPVMTDEGYKRWEEARKNINQVGKRFKL